MSRATVRSSGSPRGAGWALVVVIATAVGCGSAATPPPSSAPATASADRPAYAVTAVVLVNGCAHFGAENARLAQAAMNALVDGCSGFSGDKVQFTATLLPGGAIQFDPGPGDSKTIPVCVLNHPLTHRVQLHHACSLDVRLEATSVVVPPSVDSGR